MASPTNWKQHIEAWRAGGLSQAAYCRSHGLSPTTFSARVRALKASPTQPPPTPPALVPVRVEPAKLHPAEPLVLRTASGHCLELPASSAPGWVAELLRCLG